MKEIIFLAINAGYDFIPFLISKFKFLIISLFNVVICSVGISLKTGLRKKDAGFMTVLSILSTEIVGEPFQPSFFSNSFFF